MPRARRLGFVAVPVTQTEAAAQIVVNDLQVGEGPGSDSSITDTPRPAKTIAKANKGYAFREANWQIGRAAEKANVQVKKFVPGDRWAAWRKSQARIQANIEKKKLRNAGKKSAKPKKRQQRA